MKSTVENVGPTRVKLDVEIPPEIEVTKLDDGQSLSFTAQVDVRPDVTLPSLEGIEVSVDDAEVSDAAVDEQLDSLRDRFATLTTVDRPVASGDYVAIDLRAAVDGEEVEGGSATNLSYTVGSEDLIDGLDDAVVGLSAGESTTFPTTLRAGDQAGGDAEVTVTVNSVKEKHLPDPDDEFAQLASEFDTADELRAAGQRVRHRGGVARRPARAPRPRAPARARRSGSGSRARAIARGRRHPGA